VAKALLGCLALNQFFAGLVDDGLAVLLSTKRRSSAAGPQEVEFLEVIESTFLNDLYFPSVEL
jgi:hypothetical protein